MSVSPQFVQPCIIYTNAIDKQNGGVVTQEDKTWGFSNKKLTNTHMLISFHRTRVVNHSRNIEVFQAHVPSCTTIVKTDPQNITHPASSHTSDYVLYTNCYQHFFIKSINKLKLNRIQHTKPNNTARDIIRYRWPPPTSQRRRSSPPSDSSSIPAWLLACVMRVILFSGSWTGWWRVAAPLSPTWTTSSSAAPPASSISWTSPTFSSGSRRPAWWSTEPRRTYLRPSKGDCLSFRFFVPLLLFLMNFQKLFCHSSLHHSQHYTTHYTTTLCGGGESWWETYGAAADSRNRIFEIGRIVIRKKL